MPGARPAIAAASPAKPAEPWWKFGHVWLVISGPAIVVVAGLVTAWIALSSPDPVVDADYYRKGIEINRTLAERSLSPAMHARNHAATPTDDLPVKPAAQAATRP
ncbi:FixH family protein [Variovorax sp. VNK109]|uniref:FixH family protein n=1 Tax=Variovorax sp. VNK109 TaxID=3400919 RepID=UPI003C0F510C